MKLYVLLDHVEYEKNLAIAQNIEEYADAFMIGSLPLMRYGIQIVDDIRREFPRKILCVETKIVERPREIVSLASQNGADWISVMSGARTEVIHAAASKAHDLGKKVVLDLMGIQSSGQEALEAASLGVDALCFTYNKKNGDPKDLIESWQMIKGNTTLPIFFSGVSDQFLLPYIITIDPVVVILGKVITEHVDPRKEIQLFKEALQQ
jgi:3-keto-L-gulonate-6-phosphate decarboxylase